MSPEPPTDALDAFGLAPVSRCEPMRGGLSAASVWRVDGGGVVAALRRSPGRVDGERLRWIAAVLRRAVAGGAEFVGEPIAARDGSDAVRGPDGVWWTATRWRPGSPLGGGRSDDDERRAAEALARFHAAVAERAEARGPSRGVADRIASLESPAVDPAGGVEELVEIAARLRARSAWAIRDFADRSFAVQAVQVDSRPEHFLLSGDEVTGLVDFAAMRIDTPAIDLARLAGELAVHRQDYADWRDRVVGWYNAAARNEVSTELVAALDLSGAVVSADNWAVWAVEGRVDPRQNGPARRIEDLRRRLRSLATA